MKNDYFLREKQIVGVIVPASRSTLWRWVKEGKFPAPLKLGANTTAWRGSDVEAWVEAQKAA